MADDEVLVTYRENALPKLGFNLTELRQAQLHFEDFQERLRYCSTFFTKRPLLQAAGVVNQAQYQRAIDGEKSLERLAYLGDFQKIKENEDKISNFSDLKKVVNTAFDKTEKICEIVGVESNDYGASSLKELTGFAGIASSAMGIFMIASGGGGLVDLVIGGFLGTGFSVPISIYLGKSLRKEEAAIRQIKAMIPFYAEQAAQDLETLPRNITYLEAFCSHVQEATQENVSFYSERKLTLEEQKSLVGYLETDIPRHQHRLSQLQSKMSSVQSACQEKLAALR